MLAVIVDMTKERYYIEIARTINNSRNRHVCLTWAWWREAFFNASNLSSSLDSFPAAYPPSLTSRPVLLLKLPRRPCTET